MFDQLGDDSLENLGVALHQIEAALALALPGAGRHDANSRSRGDGVVCRAVTVYADLLPGISIILYLCRRRFSRFWGTWGRAAGPSSRPSACRPSCPLAQARLQCPSFWQKFFIILIYNNCYSFKSSFYFIGLHNQFHMCIQQLNLTHHKWWHFYECLRKLFTFRINQILEFVQKFELYMSTFRVQN